VKSVFANLGATLENHNAVSLSGLVAEVGPDIDLSGLVRLMEERSEIMKRIEARRKTLVTLGV
jgi:hypothetical protein